MLFTAQQLHLSAAPSYVSEARYTQPLHQTQDTLVNVPYG